LPVPRGTEFDEIVVPLAKRNHSGQEQELEPPSHLAWLVAHATNDEIDPLVRGELAALALKLL
jgi:hypothetical protein